MMSNKRKKYHPEFKAKVALAAVKNEATISELAARVGVRPNMIAKWKRNLIEGAADIFAKGQKSRPQTDKQDEQIDELYRQIGKLQVERDFLSNKLSL
jgi:transposase